MWLSRSSLRGYVGAVAPRFLAAFHRFCVVAAQTLVCPGPACLDISQLTTWSLVLEPGFRVHSPTLRRLPMGCHGWGVRVCLHVLKCRPYYFLEILDYISSESLVPSSVTFDSFSSSAPSIFMPRFIRKRGWECWSVSSSTSLHGS